MPRTKIKNLPKCSTVQIKVSDKKKLNKIKKQKGFRSLYLVIEELLKSYEKV